MENKMKIRNFAPYTQFKILLFIMLLYITIDFTSNMMLYKLIKVGSAVLPAGILIYPVVFLLGDIIAEVFGYRVAKLIVIFDLVFNFIFAAILYVLVRVPSPHDLLLSQDYLIVLGSLLKVNSIVIVAILIGSMINVYFISKWKIITHGRYFWIRSIGSSAIGEAVMLVFGVFFLYSGKLSLSDMIKLIECDYLFRVGYAVIGSGPATILVNYLKSRGVNTMFEKSMDNPFKK